MVEPVEDLAKDPDRLAHLLHADEVARGHVRAVGEGHVELQPVVGGVGAVLAEVALQAGGPEHRPGDPVRNAVVRLQDAQPVAPLAEDGRAEAELVVLVQPVADPVEHLAGAVRKPGRDVVADAAHAHVLVCHARAGVVLQQVEDKVAVPHAVEERAHQPDVLDEGGVPHDVGREPLELVAHRAQIVGPLGRRDVQRLLGGEDVEVLPREPGDVAAPVHERDHLVVVPVLADLLDPPVEVAHLRVDIEDQLAVDPDAKVPETVRHGVLGPHVDPHLRHGAS